MDGLVRYLRVAARGERGNPIDLRWSRKSLRAAIRDAGPALLHIVGDPWTPTAEAGAAAARHLGIPYLLVGTSSRGGPSGLTGRWQARKVVDGAAGLAGTVRSALDLLLNLTEQRRPSAVLPQGGLAIPGSIWRDRQGPLSFGITGRLVPERGVDRFFTTLGDTYGDWRCSIMGTGPSQPDLEAQAQRLGISSRVDWLGNLPREQWAEWFGSIDVLVAPSQSTIAWVEPTGAMILEAMASGVAPVVTRCGALPDVVGDAGLIVDEGNQAALTRAIQSLVADPEHARQIGSTARRRVLEEFSDGAVARKWATFWREILRPAISQASSNQV